MKFISNIVMLAVLVFNNLSVLPLAFPAQQASLDMPAAPLAATPTVVVTSEPTPTPAAIETALLPTETPTPTETALPPTETPTPTETLTPTETPAPVEIVPIVTVPNITLNVNPDFITPGQLTTLEWSIDGFALEKQAAQLEIALSPALLPQDVQDPSYDSSKNVFSISLETLKGSLKLQVLEGFDSASVHAVLLRGKETIAAADLLLPYQEKFTLDAKGGEAQTRDGRVKLSFPSDVLNGPAEVWIGKPAGDAIPRYSLSGAPFEIRAFNVENQKALSAFGDQIQIDVSYDETKYAGNESFLTLNWYDPISGDWLALPSMVDTKNNIIHGYTNHFTVFDIDVNNWQASRLPTVDSFQVANFTGAATYSMPIEVPAGPGGLQPALSLSYNSQVVDSATTQSQSSWVGMGWSLDSGYIETNSNGTSDFRDDDTFMLSVNGVSSGIVHTTANEYRLSDENFWKIERLGNPDAWRVTDKNGMVYYFGKTTASYYYVETFQNGNTDECERRSFTWRWSLTKMTNIFGQEINYNYADETKTMGIPGWHQNPDTKKWNCAYTKNGTDTKPTATYLDSILYAGGRYRVRFDREGRLDYRSEWLSDANYHAFERSRLKTIRVEQDADGNGVFENLIRKYELGYYGTSSPEEMVFPNVVWSAGGKTNTLSSIQQYGSDGTSALPATTFSYRDNQTEDNNLHLKSASNGYGGSVTFDYERWNTSDPASEYNTVAHYFGKPNMPCQAGVPAPYAVWEAGSDVDCEDQGAKSLILKGSAINSFNNYTTNLARPGGTYRVWAIYELDNPASTVQVGISDGVATGGIFQTISSNGSALLYLPPTASRVNALIKQTGLGYSRINQYKFELLTAGWRVTTRTTNDGAGHAYPTSYAYTSAALNTDANTTVIGSNPSVSLYCPDIDLLSPPAERDCLNYAAKYVEFRGHATVTETSPDGRVTVTTYNQSNEWKGRPASVVVKTTGGRKINETLYTYAIKDFNDVSLLYPEGCLVCGTPYKGLTHYWVEMLSTENRIYDANGASYSATRTELDYTDASNNLQYGNLLEQLESSGAGSNWTLYRKTTYAYAIVNSGTTYLVGLPARTEVFDGSNYSLASTQYLYDGNTGSYLTAPTSGKLTGQRSQVDATRYSQVSYAYDTWGNLTSTTTYPLYGTADTSPAVADAQPTLTTYDSTYHAYPVSTTNVLNQTTTVSYDYRLGLPTSETGPNGDMTSAEYDVFGRIIKLVRPGDYPEFPNDYDHPTMKFEYENQANGLKTTIKQRIEGTDYVWVERVYDGLGRQTLLSKGYETGGAPTTLSKVKTEYVSPVSVKQSVPYVDTDPEMDTTTTTNFFDQTTTVTKPDGTSSLTTINGLSTKVRDPMGNETTSWQDVWGRTVSVIPPTGPMVAYTYDALGRMQSVSRGGVSTTIQYDKAGRKTGMSDPDMGQWYYYYDALGNLIAQVDAKNQASNLYYDSLNRLIGKTYTGSISNPGSYQRPTDPESGNYEVENQYDGFVDGVYDSSTLGFGRRTFMRDGSGSTVWNYDVRGRLSSETKTISDTAFLTSWTYNSADLPKTMSYPKMTDPDDNEILTYNYNPDGTLFSVTSSTGDTYLQEAQYDVAGRLTNMKFGETTTNDVTHELISKTLIYYPWYTTNVGGLLASATAQTYGSSAPDLQNLGYTYDKNGNVLSITDALVLNGPQTQHFTYDALDRITSADATGGTDGKYFETYAYDATTGNLSKKNGDLLYTYDTAHPHAVSSLSNGNYYNYDGNGNMTLRSANGQDFALEYDMENRMTGVNLPTPRVMSINSVRANPNPTRASTVQFRVTFSKYVSGVEVADFALTTSGITGASVSAVSGSGTTYTVTVNTGTGSGSIKLVVPVGATILDSSGVALTCLPYTSGQAYNLDWTPPTVTSSVRVTSSPSAAAANQFTVTFSEPVTGVDRSDFSLTTTGVTSAVVSMVSGSSDVYTVTVKSQGNGTVRLNVVDDNSIVDGLGNQLGGVGLGDGSYTTGAVYSVTKSGSDTTGVFRASTGSFYLKNTNAAGGADLTISFGQTGDSPVAGDWDGNGTVTIGVYRSGTFILRNASTNLTVIFGLSGDQPVTGDWNGDGIDTVGVYRSSNNTFYLRNTNTSGTADVVVSFGMAGDVGLVGDWNGDGIDTIGVFRPSNGGVYLKNTNTSGTADITFNYGMSGDKPLAGDWNDDGIDSIGIYRSGSFYLRNTNSSGTADVTFAFGVSGDLPVIGNWDAVGVPGGLAPQVALSRQPLTGQQAANFESAEFVYDGDGNRVKSVMTTDVGTTTTYFVGNYYEKTGDVFTKYYFANGQRIAMRTISTQPATNILRYIIGDHLGSSSVVYNTSDLSVSKTSYTAWGEVRSTSGDEATKYQYTGQYSDSYINLLWYGSRHYDPALGRFISPDTIVPLAAQGSQALDRYAYTNNNPVRYTDPTGHDAVGDFVLGFISEFTRVNLWFHPQAQQVLSVKKSESDAMIVGRIAGDVAGAVVGAVEAADGVGIAGGGAVVGCGATLCMASAGAVAAGGAVALQGAGTGVNAAIGLSQNAALLGGNEQGSSSNEPNFANNDLLREHFEDHYAEFGYRTEVEYLEGARNLFKGGDKIETFYRKSDGATLYYNKNTNEFGSLNKDGTIGTYMAPTDGLNYWWRQIGK